MTTFADELRGTLAAEVAATRDAAERQEHERRAQEKPFAEARAAAAKILSEVFEPLVADFWDVMEASAVLRDGRMKNDARGPHERGVNFRALGIARARRYFEIRLWCRARREGTIEPPTIELSAECLHYYPDSATRAADPQPLLALPPATLPMESAVHAVQEKVEAARRWSGEVLKACGVALMQANFSTSTGTPAPALPLYAVPAAAMSEMPATV